MISENNTVCYREILGVLNLDNWVVRITLAVSDADTVGDSDF
jgi:hypothetical protein